MGNWVRLYNSILDDPALAAIPDDALRTWLYIQAAVGRGDGDVPGSCLRLPNLKELAWTLRMSGKESKLAKHLDILLSAGLLERVGDDGLLPRQWSSLQRASDNPTKRKRDQRNREREETKNRTLNEQRHVTGTYCSDEMSRDSHVTDHAVGHDPPPGQVTVSLSREESEREIDRSSSSFRTEARAHARASDDDDLRRRLNEAAKSRIAPSCRNVGPIRRLLADGIPLEAIIACFVNNVRHLRQPLKTFGADFIAVEARAHAEAMASAAARGENATKAIERVFVPLDAPHWPLVEARYSRERGRKPPHDSRNPDDSKGLGWMFPASWPECRPAPPREAAE